MLKKNQTNETIIDDCVILVEKRSTFYCIVLCYFYGYLFISYEGYIATNTGGKLKFTNTYQVLTLIVLMSLPYFYFAKNIITTKNLNNYKH